MTELNEVAASAGPTARRMQKNQTAEIICARPFFSGDLVRPSHDGRIQILFSIAPAIQPAKLPATIAWPRGRSHKAAIATPTSTAIMTKHPLARFRFGTPKHDEWYRSQHPVVLCESEVGGQAAQHNRRNDRRKHAIRSWVDVTHVAERRRSPTAAIRACRLSIHRSKTQPPLGLMATSYP
jgi:hypothetical protein